MPAIRNFLERRLDAGEWSIGQVLVRPDRSLRHVDDAARTDLESFAHFTDARELAKYDDAGGYRPLKTAQNLRHGWELQLGDVDEIHQALDFFYPAAIGTWLVHEEGALTAVPFRETLKRQSGMYRVTQLITDEQANELIQKTCVEGCLRNRLWTIDGVATFPMSHSEQIPVLCVEACNLLVAACRPVAKQNVPQTSA